MLWPELLGFNSLQIKTVIAHPRESMHAFEKSHLFPRAVSTRVMGVCVGGGGCGGMVCVWGGGAVGVEAEGGQLK